MGGIGSGRYKNWSKATIDGCRSLDVNTLNRAGYLEPGVSGTSLWTRAGKETSVIMISADVGNIELSYEAKTPEGIWVEFIDKIRLVDVPCNYGGTRRYFCCPAKPGAAPCGRRVAKLYQVGRLFRCRACHGLTYDSPYEGEIDRAIRKAKTSRRKLRCDMAISVEYAKRPKGMWQRTFDTLHLEAQMTELIAKRQILSRAEVVTDRFRSRRDALTK